MTVESEVDFAARIKEAIDLVAQTPGYMEIARDLLLLQSRGRIRYVPEMTDRAHAGLTGSLTLGPEALWGSVLSLAETLVHEHYHLRRQGHLAKTLSFWRGVFTRSPTMRAYERPAYDAALKEFASRPQIYVKLSEIVRRVNGQVSTDVNAYRARLDQLVATFGEDRIVFGSDWPNSDGVAPIDQIFRVAKEYFASRPRSVQEKYFWKNSVAAYKWIKREPSQPNL